MILLSSGLKFSALLVTNESSALRPNKRTAWVWLHCRCSKAARTAVPMLGVTTNCVFFCSAMPTRHWSKMMETAAAAMIHSAIGG